MKAWQIWIDTGGTFTDGLGVNPSGILKRIKVLSSGCLRARITKKIAPAKYQLDFRFPCETSELLKGYSLSVLGQDEHSYQVLSLAPASNTLHLDRAIKLTPPFTVELSAQEEAPVLAPSLRSSLIRFQCKDSLVLVCWCWPWSTGQTR